MIRETDNLLLEKSTQTIAELSSEVTVQNCKHSASTEHDYTTNEFVQFQHNFGVVVTV